MKAWFRRFFAGPTYSKVKAAVAGSVVAGAAAALIVVQSSGDLKAAGAAFGAAFLPALAAYVKRELSVPPAPAVAPGA